MCEGCGGCGCVCVRGGGEVCGGGCEGCGGCICECV